MIQIALFTLFLLIAQQSNAETIVTGDSVVETSISTNVNDGTVKSSINSKVEGNSEVKIRVETTVNGKTTVSESTESGEMRIDIVATATPIPPTNTPPKPEPKEVKSEQPSQLMKILQTILRFFK